MSERPDDRQDLCEECGQVYTDKGCRRSAPEKVINVHGRLIGRDVTRRNSRIAHVS